MMPGIEDYFWARVPGDLTQKAIAARFGVNDRLIRGIQRREMWSHV